MVRITLILMIVCIHILGFSQAKERNISVDDYRLIYKEIASFYSKNVYKISMKCSSYKSEFSKEPEDEFMGYITQKNGLLETYTFSGYSIQNENYKILVDTNERIVGISYPDSNMYMAFDEEYFTANAYQIKSSTLRIEGRERILTINFNKGNTYKKVIMMIDSYGMISKLMLYFSENISYTNDQGQKQSSQPKVVFEYRELKLNPESISIRKIEDFVKKEKNENLILSDFFSSQNFELIDFRYN